MGWVSLFDPSKLAQLLGMPADAEPVAIRAASNDELLDRAVLAINSRRALR